MRCDNCGQDVPEGAFCTRCGAQQGVSRGGGKPAKRRAHFAASPNEPVAQPAVMTALFPHLGSQEVHEFRWAFVAGVVVLVALYLFGLIPAALLVAAVLVPILYILYLYDVRVYRDAPAQVLGFTIGGGIILGVVVTLLGNAIVGSIPAVQPGPAGAIINVGQLLLVAVLIPIIQEVLKPLPALLLRGRSEFSETIDGLVFGVAAGLGFAAAQTIVQFSRVITTLDVQGDPGNWIFPLLTIGVLLPILHGSATGLITAAVWRFRGHRWGMIELLGIPVAIAAHIAFLLGTELLQANGANALVWLGFQAAVVAALLIYLRFLLHDVLLDEAANMGLSITTCPNCEREVTAAGFCPVCGMAMSAVSQGVKDARQQVAEAPGGQA